jgi:hypothetical protein
MVYFSILQAMGFMLLLAGIGFVLYVYKFLTLRGVVWLKTADMREVMAVFANMGKLENPEQHLARLARMSPCDVKLEIERGNMIGIVSTICGIVLKDLEKSAPESTGLTKKIEARLKI